MDIRLIKACITTALAALVLTIGSASADDTDVYMNPGAGLPPGSEPMVMFSLDYRPNLGSTACNGNECDTLIKEGYMPATGPYTFFDVLRGALRKVFDPIDGNLAGRNKAAQAADLALEPSGISTSDTSFDGCPFHDVRPVVNLGRRAGNR